MKKNPTDGYRCHCGKKKDWYSKECYKCVREHGGRFTWTNQEVDFLRLNYPTRGAAWCAQQLGIDKEIVIDKANKMKISLKPEARRTIVHDAAADYMRENNPSKKPGAMDRLRRQPNFPHRIALLLKNCLQTQKDRPSSLEKKLWTILDALGVAYETQVVIKSKFIVDVRIGYLVIEADGDWWHGHPRFEPLKEKQLKQQAKDRSRDAYLTACGYEVERIWESDISSELVRAILVKHRILPAE